MQEKEKKEKVYSAVLELFKEGKNIKDIKVSEIADRAGIGKGSIYMYFKSKDAVIVDAVKYFFGVWLTPFREYNIDNSIEFKKIVEDFLEIHKNLSMEYKNFINLSSAADYLMVFDTNTLPNTIAIAIEARNEYLDILKLMLQAGEKQGIISYINLYSINIVCDAILSMTRYLALKDISFPDHTVTEDECMSMTYDMIVRICK